MPILRSWQRDIIRNCQHTHEQIFASRSTDSDTEIRSLRCSDCGAVREEEILGSVARGETMTEEEWQACENFTGRAVRLERGL